MKPSHTFVLIIIFFISDLQLFSQTQLSGYVANSDGNKLQNVFVQLLSKSMEEETDENGEFLFNANFQIGESLILHFCKEGYKCKEELIYYPNNNGKLERIISLDEVPPNILQIVVKEDSEEPSFLDSTKISHDGTIYTTNSFGETFIKISNKQQLKGNHKVNLLVSKKGYVDSEKDFFYAPGNASHTIKLKKKNENSNLIFFQELTPEYLSEFEYEEEKQEISKSFLGKKIIKEVLNQIINKVKLDSTKDSIAHDLNLNYIPENFFRNKFSNQDRILGIGSFYNYGKFGYNVYAVGTEIDGKKITGLKISYFLRNGAEQSYQFLFFEEKKLIKVNSPSRKIPNIPENYSLYSYLDFAKDISTKLWDYMILKSKE